MNNMKKLLCLLLAMVMLVSLVACGPEGDPTTSAPAGSSSSSTPSKGQTTEYKITIQNFAGKPMAGVQVFLNTQAETGIDISQTNSEGVATFTAPRQDGYYVTLGNVPKGYKYDEKYNIVGNGAAITLRAEPIQGESMNGASFEVGDIIYDFEFTDSDGNTHKVSDALKEKDVLILNFFFTTCSPCIAEVPHMEDAYQEFKEDVELWALNSYGETMAQVAVFKEQYGISFPTAAVPYEWSSMAYNPEYLSPTYPTTYVIDRYGTVCIKEFGGVPSLHAWRSVMQYFSADDYVQKLCPGGFDDVVVQVTPNVDNETAEDLAQTLGNADGNIVFSNDESEENTYTWPFKISTENYLGRPYVYATNSGTNPSYSMLIANVELKKGQAIGFDYMVSVEPNMDILNVIVNNEPIYRISGYDEVPQWKSAYPWVAEEDGTYQVVFAYIKDESQPEKDDNGKPVKYTDSVYLSNFRIVDNVEDLDVETFLPADAYKEVAKDTFEYPEVFLNEKDGYYHVGSVDGPLLLANMMIENILFEMSVYEMSLDGKFGFTAEQNRLIEIYANYASKSKRQYYCTVNQELAELLKAAAAKLSWDHDPNEWLQLCMYYNAYGTDGKQLEDPISGIAFFSALEAKEGENKFTYDGTPLIPRGKLAKFVPTRSGVYRITTDLEYEGQEANGFIFLDDSKHILEIADDPNSYYVHEPDERMYSDGANLSMVYYMEAGKSYYIDICFYDVYGAGDLPYTIEYVGESYDLFRLAAPAYFTGTVLPDGSYDSTNLQKQGILVMVGEDGMMYENRGTKENPIQGSPIYLDMVGYHQIMNAYFQDIPRVDTNGDPVVDEDGNQLYYKGLLSLDAFNFTMSGNDQMLMNLVKQGYDTYEKLDAKLRDILGENYDANIGEYRVQEFLDGIYHGVGIDKSEKNQRYLRELFARLGLDATKYETEEIIEIDGTEYKVIRIENGTEFVKGYLDDLVEGDPDQISNVGCVAVDNELALYLQLLIDTHNFDQVEDSWLKLCYYFDHMGPA